MNGDSLQAADQAAAEQSAGQGAGDTVLPCQRQDRRVVEARVVGEDGEPLQAVALELLRGDGQVLRGKTDREGRVRFQGLEEGSYQLSLYTLDQDAWEVTQVEALPTAEAKSAGEAAWEAGPTPEQDVPFTHTVAQGECISKLGDRFGFFPGTLWELPDNAALKQTRGSMNILSPGDAVAVPARRKKTVDVRTGNRYRIRRKGVPATLRVRFLDYDGQPRAGVPYLVQLKTEDGKLNADRQGATDEAGFLSEAIPPGTTLAEVVLGKGASQETHSFRVGSLDPLDTVSGVQARLNGLGLPCGAVDGQLGEATEAALRAFQQKHGLEATGQITDATREKLKALFLS